jgi:hypothetical protein
MTSLTASESFTPLPYVPLAHSYNSRGELGFMVSPSGCSCTTCVDYVGAQRSASPAPAPLATPPPPQHSLVLGMGSDFWARFNPLPPGQGWGAPSPALEPTLSRFNTLPPGAPSPALARSSSVAEEETLEDFQERTLESLRSLHRRLQERQDVLYDEEQRSHDEMAAADTEWEELDRKMTAIDALLEAFQPQ